MLRTNKRHLWFEWCKGYMSHTGEKTKETKLNAFNLYVLTTVRTGFVYFAAALRLSGHCNSSQ